MMRQLIFIGIFLLTHLMAIGQVKEQKLVPADNGPGDFFGRYLSLAPPELLVSAHQDDENGYASGSLYTFREQPDLGIFSENQKIVPSDGNVEEFFGYSVDIDGILAVTGSHHDSDFGGSSGSAFLLQLSGGDWQIVQKLHPDDPRAGDEFGKAVSISGDEIAVGAFLDDDQATNSGSVYLYHKLGDSFSFLQEIYPEDAEAYDQFGNFLVLRNGILAVGVPEKNTGVERGGCVYVFRKEDGHYMQQAKIIPPEVETGAGFGNAVDLQGDMLAVGAWKSSRQNPSGGAVFLFRKNGQEWEFFQELVPPDNEEGDHFGISVSLSEDRLAAGAYFDDELGPNSGSVYIYELKGSYYSMVSKITASGGKAGDAFGASVDMSGNLLAVGAYADSGNGFFSGAAYVYDLGLILSVDRINRESSLPVVSPSLFTNRIHIKLDRLPSVPVRCQIFNLSGHRIFKGEFKIQHSIISTEDWVPGIYIINLETESGSHVYRLIRT